MQDRPVFYAVNTEQPLKFSVRNSNAESPVGVFLTSKPMVLQHRNQGDISDIVFIVHDSAAT